MDVLEQLTVLARQAGAAILAVYEKEDVGLQHKADDSPLTAADLAAHEVIVNGLARLSDLPVLSEEGTPPPWSERQTWERYWLVDPLDGTKEFVNRNGEFTVNIALIEDGVPTMGVVYVPVKDVLYAGFQRDGGGTAWKEDDTGRHTISTRPFGQDRVTVVGSRRHGSEALDAMLVQLRQHFGEVEMTNMGSSLKICLVAAGAADLYPRLAPTCEWDTAAAQAVLEAAGGVLVDDQFVPLRYNTKEDLLNPYFYVLGSDASDWEPVLRGSAGDDDG